jgi:hypothetical protein
MPRTVQSVLNPQLWVREQSRLLLSIWWGPQWHAGMLAPQGAVTTSPSL